MNADLIAGKYARITREWSDADEIVLTVPMEINYRQAGRSIKTVSVSITALFPFH